MIQVPPKRRRMRLASRSYLQLREFVLQRDGWRCQFCGSIAGVEVHHIQFRSRRGQDGEENLITLCAKCHREIHE